MECDGCGADLGPTDVACRYCRRATPFALQRHAEESAREARAAAERAFFVANQQATSRSELESVAKRALLFSVLGVAFMFPVLSLLAVPPYLRARTLARELGVALPGSAKIALVLALSWIVVVPFVVACAVLVGSSH